MIKKSIILFLLICLLFSGCSHNSNIHEDNKEILLTINDEPLYAEELEKIISQYEEKGLTETEIIEGMILELVTLQQADEFSVSVSDEDVNSIVDELSNLEQTLFYEKALEQYGSEDTYKQAVYYKMVYDKITEKIKENFVDNFLVNSEIMQIRINDYTSQYTSGDFEANDMDEDLFFSEVKDTYYGDLLSVLSDLHFKVWRYKTAKESKLSYVSYNGSDLFQKQSYNITSDSLEFKGENYELKEVSLAEIQDRFGNYFYIPNAAQERYGFIQGKAVHVLEKDVRGLYLTLGEETTITVKIIIAPILSLYNDFQGNSIIKGIENNQNKIEYFQPELGIYYSLIGDIEYTELEKILVDHITYSIVADNLDSELSDGYSQHFEEASGDLYFNNCIPTAYDMVYFNPQIARTEQWNLEQVVEYLGISSFTPSYIPKGLNLYPYGADSFVSEYVNDKMYWTVAYEDDLLVYDNFGFYFSDFSLGEDKPLRRTLLVEASKDDIPASDVGYIFETTKLSKIKDIELVIGGFNSPYYNGGTEPVGYSEIYVAEFIINNVGYRIKSQNLTQAEFIEVLTSMPVF